MEANRQQERREIQSLRRSKVELEKRVVKLEKLVNVIFRKDRRKIQRLWAEFKHQRRRQAAASVEGRPRFSSTTIFTSTATSSSTSSSLPESTPSVTSTSAGPPSEPSLSTGQQPSSSSSSSTDSVPSAPIVDPNTPESGDEDDVEVENNSWATLLRISFEGDPDVDVILTELRKLAMQRVQLWSPTKPEILAKKAKIVKWILKPDNIHKFTTLKATFSTSRITSMWRGLVDELFPEIRNPAPLITYFGNASRSTHFFGEFVTEVVRVHRQHCRKCALQVDVSE